MAKFMRPACTRETCQAVQRNQFKFARAQDRAAGKVVPWSHWERERFVDPSALKRASVVATGKTYFRNVKGVSIRVRGLAP
jgi:hypothetical protein